MTGAAIPACARGKQDLKEPAADGFGGAATLTAAIAASHFCRSGHMSMRLSRREGRVQ